jgi:hypothetical protein
MVEGTWYCPSMPEVLVNATVDLRAGRIDATTHQARIAARADFALRRKSGPDTDGYERFMCPAGGDRPKVRCGLRPPSLGTGPADRRRTPLEPPRCAAKAPSPSRPTSVPACPEPGLWIRVVGPPLRHAAQHHRGLERVRQGPRPRGAGAACSPARARHRRPRNLDHLPLRGRQLRKIDTYEKQLINRDVVQARKRALRRRTSLKDFIPG